MPTMTEMKEAVETKVLEMMVKFEEEVGSACKYPVKLPREIKFNVKGQVAGYAYFDYLIGEGHLDFNPIIMEDNWERFIERTVPHEVAHFCVSLYVGYLTSRNGRRICHGKDWKGMMRYFGISDSTRCHSYDTSRAKTKTQRRWEYKCECSTHMLSTTMHNKIRKGSVRVCRSCRTNVNYVGV